MTLVGSIHYLLGDLDGAAELGRQRLKMEEQLRANHDSEKLEHEIANTLEGNGFFEIWLGDYDSAFDDERRALTMNEAFLRADPASARNLGRVLVSHNWIAMTLKFASLLRPQMNFNKAFKSTSNSPFATRMTPACG